MWQTYHLKLYCLLLLLSQFIFLVFFRLVLTSKESQGRQTKAPNQAMVAFTKASRARKAIRLAAMLATRAMDWDAPAAAASSKFLYCLKWQPQKTTLSHAPEKCLTKKMAIFNTVLLKLYSYRALNSPPPPPPAELVVDSLTLMSSIAM